MTKLLVPFLALLLLGSALADSYSNSHYDRSNRFTRPQIDEIDPNDMFDDGYDYSAQPASDARRSEQFVGGSNEKANPKNQPVQQPQQNTVSDQYARGYDYYDNNDYDRYNDGPVGNGANDRTDGNVNYDDYYNTGNTDDDTNYNSYDDVPNNANDDDDFSADQAQGDNPDEIIDDDQAYDDPYANEPSNDDDTQAGDMDGDQSYSSDSNQPIDQAYDDPSSNIADIQENFDENIDAPIDQQNQVSDGLVDADQDAFDPRQDDLDQDQANNDNVKVDDGEPIDETNDQDYKSDNDDLKEADDNAQNDEGVDEPSGDNDLETDDNTQDDQDVDDAEPIDEVDASVQQPSSDQSNQPKIERSDAAFSDNSRGSSSRSAGQIVYKIDGFDVIADPESEFDTDDDDNNDDEDEDQEAASDKEVADSPIQEDSKDEAIDESNTDSQVPDEAVDDDNEPSEPVGANPEGQDDELSDNYTNDLSSQSDQDLAGQDNIDTAQQQDLDDAEKWDEPLDESADDGKSERLGGIGSDLNREKTGPVDEPLEDDEEDQNDDSNDLTNDNDMIDDDFKDPSDVDENASSYLQNSQSQGYDSNPNQIIDGSDQAYINGQPGNDEDLDEDYNSNQNQDQNTDQDLGQNQDQGLDQAMDQDLNQDQNRDQDQDPEQDMDQDLNQDQNRDQDQDQEQDMDQDLSQNQAQDQAFDQDLSQDQDQEMDEELSQDQDQNQNLDQDQDQNQNQDMSQDQTQNQNGQAESDDKINYDEDNNNDSDERFRQWKELNPTDYADPQDDQQDQDYIGQSDAISSNGMDEVQHQETQEAEEAEEAYKTETTEEVEDAEEAEEMNETDEREKVDDTQDDNDVNSSTFKSFEPNHIVRTLSQDDSNDGVNDVDDQDHMAPADLETQPSSDAEPPADDDHQDSEAEPLSDANTQEITPQEQNSDVYTFRGDADDAPIQMQYREPETLNQDASDSSSAVDEAIDAVANPDEQAYHPQDDDTNTDETVSQAQDDLFEDDNRPDDQIQFDLEEIRRKQEAENYQNQDADSYQDPYYVAQNASFNENSYYQAATVQSEHYEVYPESDRDQIQPPMELVNDVQEEIDDIKLAEVDDAFAQQSAEDTNKQAKETADEQPLFETQTMDQIADDTISTAPTENPINDFIEPAEIFEQVAEKPLAERVANYFFSSSSTEPIVEPTVEPSVESEKRQITELTPEIATESVIQSKLEPIPEPEIKPVLEPIPEPTAIPAVTSEVQSSSQEAVDTPTARLRVTDYVETKEEVMAPVVEEYTPKNKNKRILTEKPTSENNNRNNNNNNNNKGKRNNTIISNNKNSNNKTTEIVDTPEKDGEYQYDILETVFIRVIAPLYKIIRTNQYTGHAFKTIMSIIVILAIRAAFKKIFGKKQDSLLAEVQRLKAQVDSLTTISQTLTEGINTNTFAMVGIKNELKVIGQALAKSEISTASLLNQRKKADNFILEFQHEVMESHKALWTELHGLRKLFDNNKAPVNKPLTRVIKTNKEFMSNQHSTVDEGDTTPMPVISKPRNIKLDLSRDSKRSFGPGSAHEASSAQVVTTTKKDFRGVKEENTARLDGRGPLSNILGLTQTVSSSFFDETPVKLVSSPLDEIGSALGSTVRLGSGNLKTSRVNKLLPRTTPIEF